MTFQTDIHSPVPSNQIRGPIMKKTEGNPVPSFFKKPGRLSAANTRILEAIQLELAQDLETKSSHAYTRGIIALYPSDKTKSPNPVGIRFLEYSARRNNVVAMVKLGTFYRAGKFVKRDLQKAALYLQQAADLGNAEAAHNFADMCQKGEGVPSNDRLARKYAAQAQREGYSSGRPATKYSGAVIGPPRTGRLRTQPLRRPD